MKKILILLIPLLSFSQINLPIDFENNQIINQDFIFFNGGSGYVVFNPQVDDNNPSEKVGVIIRDGGDIWAGSYLELDDYLDFSENTTLNMQILSPYPGLLVKFKIEGDQGDFPSEPATERDAYTTSSNQWETLSWDFSGEASNTYRKLVLMFDFGNIGDGSLDSTFYFDNIFQSDPSGGLVQMDLPVTFDDPSVYYVLTDFGGNGPSTILETVDGNYARVEKNPGAESWAGLTIGSGAGFLNQIPVSNTDTKIYADIYVSGTDQIGIPIRLKIENSNDPTQSVETDSFTTLSGEWETMEFDFSNHVDGTQELNTNFYFNKASIFFNFGNPGNQNTIFYFDNVFFGSPLSIQENVLLSNLIYPIPSSGNIFLNSDIEFDAIIFNSIGEQVFKKKVKKDMDISKLEKGIYFLHLFDGANNSIHKIVKD
jgi:hypothetical protein